MITNKNCRRIVALFLTLATMFLCVACGKPTEMQAEALESAKAHMEEALFSQQRLTDILVEEGYSKNEVKYAIKHLEVNFYDVAEQRAKNYVEFFNLKEKELIEQLQYEKFNVDQINYAIRKAGF